MPELSLPPEAVRDASCDLAALSQDWVGYAWPAELTDKIVETVWAALLPHLGEHVAQRIEAQCGSYSHEPDEIRRCRIHNAGRIAREAFPKET